MYLPGTVNERITDLRTNKGLSQKELSEIIGVAPSQLSRIENGETQRISSDVLVKLAKAFGVSTDFMLGLTTISVPKSYDISELGLSEGTVRALVTGAVDVQIINRLIEHKSFAYLLYLVRRYFDDSITAGIKARNEILDFATSTISDYIVAYPEHKAESRDGIRYIKSEKLGDHEAELEKLKSTFISILKDIKKDVELNGAQSATATAEFLQKIREQQHLDNVIPKEISAEDMADTIVNMIGQTTSLDETSTEMFKQLAMHMFTKQSES